MIDSGGLMRTATDVTIRDLQEGDYAVVAEIQSAVSPDAPRTSTEIREEITRLDRSRYVSEWFVAEERAGGRVVAFGAYRHTPWAFHPHKYRINLNVHPRYQSRGIGTRMMDQMLDALERRGAEQIMSYAREDRANAVAFLSRYGFSEYARDFEARLDVERCDLRTFGGYEERVSVRGITITTLARELEIDPHCLRAVYEVMGVLDIGAPREDPDLPMVMPLSDFLAHDIHHPNALHDAFFLAKIGDFLVGMSALKRTGAQPEVLHQQLTGVLPEYRGIGIATALKLRTIAYAQRHGYREIRTWNSSRNTAMLAINTKFGFKRQPAWVAFRKTLLSGQAAG
jgi:mycothiol synthase